MNSMFNQSPVSQASRELEFAYKVRRALDEKVSTLPDSTIERLSAARKLAIARKKPETALHVRARQGRLAGASGTGTMGNRFNNPFGWLVRVGIAVPLIVLIVGSFGIYQYENDRRINELAELDAAVLSDELPLTAYLDHGFDVFLNRHGE